MNHVDLSLFRVFIGVQRIAVAILAWETNEKCYAVLSFDCAADGQSSDPEAMSGVSVGMLSLIHLRFELLRSEGTRKTGVCLELHFGPIVIDWEITLNTHQIFQPFNLGGTRAHHDQC
jgi:hypothetical protein